jgi:hypothetical protein
MAVAHRYTSFERGCFDHGSHPSMKKTFLLFASVILFVFPAVAQQAYEQGTILKWDVEAYGKQKQQTQNAAVYYVQIRENVYRVTQGKTKPGPEASSVGKQIQCRVKKDNLYIIDEKGKELKYSVIGISKAQ